MEARSSGHHHQQPRQATRCAQCAPDLQQLPILVSCTGGSPAQSDLVHSCIRRLAKETRVPVFTFAHDVAASGG